VDIAALLGALFNTFLVVFIVASMLSAGFTTTVPNLVSVLKRYWLILAVLVGALVLRPLAGLFIAELFSLDVSAFIALIILASVAGAPLGLKFVMAAGGSLTTGAALQVMLAVIGSFTFAPTANLLLEFADLGADISLPVWDILRAVVILQIVPFAIGMLTRYWVSDTALEWNKTAVKISGPAFLAFLALGILGSWRMIIDLIGDRALIAGIVFAIVALIIGYVVSVGDRKTRETSGLVEIGTNAGPAFAAIAIAFQNEASIVGAAVAMLLIQIILGAVMGGYFGKSKGGDEAEAAANGGEGEGSTEPAATPAASE